MTSCPLLTLRKIFRHAPFKLIHYIILTGSQKLGKKVTYFTDNTHIFSPEVAGLYRLHQYYGCTIPETESKVRTKQN